MNIRKSLLVLGIISLTLVGKNALANSKEKGYSINAISNLPENTLVYLSKITDVKLEFVDSTRVNNQGDFKFVGDVGEESLLYYITFDKQTPPGIPLVLESGAKLKFDIVKDQFIDFTVTGGKYNQSMQKLHSVYTSFDKEMVEFNEEVAKINSESATVEMRAEITNRYNKLIESRTNKIEDFIKTEPGSPATYFAVKYLFQKPVSKLILLGSEKLGAEFPESTYTAQLQKEAKIIGPTVEGRLAPDIKLFTPQGDSVSLSSLRGKVVLIDFWASWCGPCRKENPYVKAVYEKYKDKGFEIYGVSLDNNMRNWQAAIAKDGLTWTHVSDLKGWKSSAAKLYGVRSIPQTFLIDREGRIVKSGLRSHDLESALKTLLD
jgi:peroxiredoxin